jgi:hypothetical protein
MPEFKDEIILPRRSPQQRDHLPHVAPAGDCGGCVLAGLTGLSLEQVYEQLKDGKREPFSYPTMRSALYDARRLGLLEQIIVEHPLWFGFYVDSCSMFGSPSWRMSLEWSHYIHMALEAGYYPICEVNMAGNGPLVLNDHWQMIVGARNKHTKNIQVEGAWNIDAEVLVNCSSQSTPDEQWIECREYLTKYGGFNCFLAKPKNRA